MTIRQALAAELGYNDTVRLDGRTFAVRTVQPGRLVYRGRTFPVVFVGGVRPGGTRVRYTLLADRMLAAITW